MPKLKLTLMLFSSHELFKLLKTPPKLLMLLLPDKFMLRLTLLTFILLSPNVEYAKPAPINLLGVKIFKVKSI